MTLPLIGACLSAQASSTASVPGLAATTLPVSTSTSVAAVTGTVVLASPSSSLVITAPCPSPSLQSPTPTPSLSGALLSTPSPCTVISLDGTGVAATVTLATPSPTTSAAPTGLAGATGSPSPVVTPGAIGATVGPSAPVSTPSLSGPSVSGVAQTVVALGAPPVTIPGSPGSPPEMSGFGGVLGLLSAPANVGVENPALRHFAVETPSRVTVATAGAASVPAAPSPTGSVGTPRGGVDTATRLLASTLMPSLLVALVLLVAVRRRVPAGLRRLTEIAAMPFAAVAAVSLTLLMLLVLPQVGGQTVADLAVGPSALTTPTQTAVPQASAARRENMPTSAIWQRLTGIETTVSALQARLASAPAFASQVTQDEPLLSSARSGAPATTTPPSTSSPLAVQLENALQTEYAFFVAAVQNPAQQQALLAAAQVAAPDARLAVLYDVQAVKTQLAQEAAIQQAQQSILVGTGPAPTTLTAPLNGVVSQGFGATDFALEPSLTFDGVSYPHFHTGIDITAPLDSPVRAAADGVVVIAGASTDSLGNLVGYGNYVVISHAGRMVTLYGHLDRLLVHAGQVVKAGDVIGLEGSTGNSTGPHLHFEVRLAGLLVDPMKYLGSQSTSR